MSFEETERLLRKYDESYVPGEKRTNVGERRNKQRQHIAKKHVLVDELVGELNSSLLTGNDVEHIHYLVDKFNNFRELHGKCKNETIILTFIFYQIKIQNPNLDINDYGICKKYGLSNNVFELIICRLLKNLIQESPIIPRHTIKYDHELLSRTGKRGGHLY